MVRSTSWAPLFRVSQASLIKVSAGAAISSAFKWGRVRFQADSCYWQNSVPCVSRTEGFTLVFSVFFSLPEAAHISCCVGLSTMAICFLKTSQGKGGERLRLRKMELTILYNTSTQSCTCNHILPIISAVFFQLEAPHRSFPHLKGQDHIKDMPGGGDCEATLRCPSTIIPFNAEVLMFDHVLDFHRGVS